MPSYCVHIFLFLLRVVGPFHPGFGDLVVPSPPSPFFTFLVNRVPPCPCFQRFPCHILFLFSVSFVLLPSSTFRHVSIFHTFVHRFSIIFKNLWVCFCLFFVTCLWRNYLPFFNILSFAIPSLLSDYYLDLCAVFTPFDLQIGCEMFSPCPDFTPASLRTLDVIEPVSFSDTQSSTSFHLLCQRFFSFGLLYASSPSCVTAVGRETCDSSLDDEGKEKKLVGTRKRLIWVN